jgi:signal transduction histidine kinase
VNPHTHGAHPQSLGELIRASRNAIVGAWEASVRTLPLPGIPGPLLREEMPEVVDTIAALADSPQPPSPPDTELPEQHALQRLGVGFELAHLLMEFSALRNCILDVVGHRIRLTLESVRILNRSIDLVANRSVQRFTQIGERLLKALDQVTAEVFRSKKLDDLLERLVKLLMEISPSVHSVAILLNENGQLRVRAAAGLIAERDPSFAIRVGEGFSGTIAAERRPRLCRSAAHDPLVRSDFMKIRGIRALYGVPLADVDVVGVAHMGSVTAHDFTTEEKLLFQTIATRATVAIVHAQLLERLEEQHRLVLSTVRQMPIGVVIRDASGNFVVSNDAASSMLRGETPWSETGVPPTWRMIDAEGREIPQAEWPLFRALRGAEIGVEDCFMRWPDGAVRTFAASAAPVRDQKGRILAGVVVFEDVTDRRRAEQERQLFIGSMSHDLRSPLGVIRMAVESMIVRDQDRSHLDSKALHRIISNAHRMERLIQHLLDFACSQNGGGLAIEPEHLDLVAFSRQMIESLQSTDAARMVLEAPDSAFGTWDPDRLAQLLQNLIGNALEHGRRDTPIKLAIRGNQRDVELSVSNRGAPIPPHLLPHIFEPFRRGNDRGGLGLGLYICREIARSHQGEINVSSNEEGTTFTVRLPR